MEGRDRVRKRLRPSRRWARWAVSAALAGGASAALLITTLAPSGATEPHSQCNLVSAGGQSGWCGLYPGNAVSNVQDLGSVAVGTSGLTVTVQTEVASNGGVPDTSFACLVPTPIAQIADRLQETQCNEAGGVWVPFTSGIAVIDLSQYPQLRDTQFTIQVAANQAAENANGDAFYNNFSVSTVTAGGPSS